MAGRAVPSGTKERGQEIEANADVPELIVQLSDRIDNLAALMRESDEPGSADDHSRSASTIAGLRDELAKVREEADDRQTLLARIASLEVRHAATTTNFERLKNRRAVRLAIRMADLGSAKLLPLRGLRRTPRRLRRPYRTQREVANTLRQMRPDRGRVEGPMVSIVVPTRNGADHLRRLLEGLERRTAYRSFELIVVDNGSTDETASVLRSAASHIVNVLANTANQTFSESCNQGAEAATGDLILFLNNDTDPINHGWLGSMVDSLVDEDHPNRVAVGAVLVYPQGRNTRAPGQAPLTVQHRGIAFNWIDGGPRPVNLGVGDNPDDSELLETWTAAAATAACLMVRRTAFESVGGFTDRYVYGWEDVDLCMKLRHEGGEIAVSGQAVLFHHEFGTQDRLGAERRRVNYLNNSRLFMERWTPQLRRLVQRDKLAGAGMWAAAANRSMAITVTDLDQAAGFGDWYTARELGDAFASQGWTVRYIQRKHDEWSSVRDIDVVIALLPQFDPRTLPSGTISVAWVRNWVDRWIENDGFDAYHTVVASTETFAEHIRQSSLHNPAVIPLATNPDRFTPGEPDMSLRCDYTFAGSAWGGPRDIVDNLEVRPQEDFKLFGKGWDRFGRGTRYWRGHLAYDRLPALYSSTKIVLDDTVEPNLPSLNSRVFDALAAGALVITDNEHGSEEWFEGLLPTYSDRSELREQLDHFLSDTQARSDLVDQLRELVLDRHTYARRATQFEHAIEANIEAPAIGIRIAPPTWKEAPAWGDTHFARDLASALRSRGMRVEIAVRDEWDTNERQGVDIALHLRGLRSYSVKPGHINMMWIISHPADVEPEECERYDVVVAAGAPLAADLGAKLGIEVPVLAQATDPGRFHPGPRDDTMTTDLLFVGNSRGQARPIVEWAIDAGVDLTVYGTGWEGTAAEPAVKAELLANELVPTAYRSAGIVLNDHWPDMAEAGIVSNRVLDALAAGAVVITDDAAGMAEMLGETVSVVAGQDDLVKAIAAIRADRSTYAQRAVDGSETVRRDHTFRARADSIIDLLTPLFEGWGGIAGGAPEWWRLDRTTDGD